MGHLIAFSFSLLAQLPPPSTAQPAQPPDQLSVQQAVSEALEHNLDLRADRARAPIAEAGVLAARLRPNPVLSFSADHLDLVGTGFNELNGAGPPELSVRTDVVWERGGKRGRRVEVAERERTVVGWEVLDRVRGLAFDVQSAFVDLLLAQESLKLARDNLASMNGIAEVNAVRVRTGDLPEVELMRTRVAVLQLENTVHQAELVQRAAQSHLQLLLGRRGPSDRLEAIGEFRREPGATASEDLEHRALARRPDLQAVMSNEARSTAELRLQIALGRVDCVFGAEFRRQQGVNGLGNSLGFFMSAPLPLFNRNQGEIARARGEASQASLQVQALRTTIASEVQAAFNQHVTARVLVERIETELLTQAREVREITEYAYRRGETRFVELLDAERAFNEAMQSYVSARAEYARSLYLIDAVSGEGVAP